MSARFEDWLRQAKRDLEHTQRALEDGDYEWTCFASQHGAEKAVKSLESEPQCLGAFSSRVAPTVTRAMGGG